MSKKDNSKFITILLISLSILLVGFGIMISYGIVYGILYLIFKLLGFAYLFKWQYAMVLYLIIVLIKFIFGNNSKGD